VKKNWCNAVWPAVPDVPEVGNAVWPVVPAVIYNGPEVARDISIRLLHHEDVSSTTFPNIQLYSPIIMLSHIRTPNLHNPTVRTSNHSQPYHKHPPCDKQVGVHTR
jgi:hypothetical protein